MSAISLLTAGLYMPIVGTGDTGIWPHEPVPMFAGVTHAETSVGCGINNTFAVEFALVGNYGDPVTLDPAETPTLSAINASGAAVGSALSGSVLDATAGTVRFILPSTYTATAQTITLLITRSLSGAQQTFGAFDVIVA